MLRDELQKFGIPPNAEGLRQVLSFEVVDIIPIYKLLSRSQLVNVIIAK
jgi:hypothetical protein